MQDVPRTAPPPLPYDRHMAPLAATWVPTVVYYHRGCADGFGAAWAIRTRFPRTTIEFIPANYGEEPAAPAGGWKDARVAVVDFSFKPPVLRRMIADGAHSVLVLDHHKTAEADLSEFNRGVVTTDTMERFAAYVSNPTLERIVAHFDTDRSGAALAWDFFHGGMPLPPLLAHVQDRDLWRFSLPLTKPVVRALMSYEQTFAQWDWCAANVGTLVDQGHALLRADERYLVALMQNAYVDTVLERLTPETTQTYRVAVCNAPHFFASDLGNRMLAHFPDADFAAVWSQGNGTRYWSLRSENTRADVSVIAKLHGGGGHRNAAGYTENLPGGPV